MRALHESDTAESVMPGRLVAGLWTLNPDRRTFESGLLVQPGGQFFDNLKIPSSSNGRTLRSERGNRGSSPREGAGAMVYRQDG